VLSLGLGGNDMLIPSAALHSNVCCATDRDVMYNEDLTTIE
jgi:hypothetical protein